MCVAGSLLLATTTSQATPLPAAGGVPVETLAQLGKLIDATLASPVPAGGDTGREFRALAVPESQEDCDTYLTLALGGLMTECATLAGDLQTLTSTTSECKRVYDFSKPKLDSLCSNKCYSVMVEALDNMAKSGCAPDGLIKTMCDQCPEDTACVKGVCRPKCSTNHPCTCNDECVEGSCKPSDQVGVQQTEMGAFGYKISLEVMCLKPPPVKPVAVKADTVDNAGPVVSKDAQLLQLVDNAAPTVEQGYCFTSMFGALEELTPDVCDKIEATGCCAATVLQYGLKCALANDSISVNNGAPMPLTSLINFCPNVDFQAECANTPVYAAGQCKLGYTDGPGVELPFPSLASFARSSIDFTGMYALIGGIALMCMILLAVTVVTRRGNRRKQAEATKAAEAMKTNVSTPPGSPVASPIDII
jgi:pentatricopeptide repeat protein